MPNEEKADKRWAEGEKYGRRERERDREREEERGGEREGRLYTEEGEEMYICVPGVAAMFSCDIVYINVACRD